MSRLRLNLNRQWKFLRGEAAGAERPDFDDSDWQPVGLPHTFDLPYFRTPEFYVGVGWYRRRITMHRAMEYRYHLAGLEFAGAFQVADVFVNGKHVGQHRGGYTGFFIANAGFAAGVNLVAVRVSNEWNPQLSPRAGEHIFSGGLYRDVYFVVAPRMQIEWNGIGITTPQVTRDSAVVRATTDVRFVGIGPKPCKVRQTIIDPDGSTISSFENKLEIGTGERITFDQFSEPILRPKLWHPDHPHLYTLRTEVFRRDELLDHAETRFGIRWFEWTPDRGFFLNGDHLYLRGTNVHQDHAGWGIGITRAACERDVRLIKEAGFNFVRGAHYPHHPAFADGCDRLGLIFWSENCFWGKGGFGPEGYWNASAYPVNDEDFEPFESHCKQTLAEMIRINRNHPSIMVWSMTNEAFFTYNLDRAKTLMRGLVDLSHQLDPTRPAAIGGAQRGEVDTIGDVAGYNGDGARLFIDPGVPNMVSEYGAITKPHDAYDPFFGDLQSERFAWRSGEAIWCACDYGSIAGKQGLKGILRHDRLPKQSWHWYRDHSRGATPQSIDGIESADVPARLRLTSDKATLLGTDATDDAQIIVTVCDASGDHVDASPPVTLTIESGPGEFPTGRSITFDRATDIVIAAGQAAIAMRSYHGGQTLIRATSPGLEDATLTIHTIGEPGWVEGSTPVVSPRPYTPPPVSAAALAAMKNAVNVALNRPSRASDETGEHPARYANDGNRGTCWQCASGDRPWWMVDLEGFYQLSCIKLVFPSRWNWRFIVELSRDRQTWTPAIDRSKTERTDATRNDILPPGAIARYVRLTFIAIPAGLPVGLCEFEAHGVLSVR